MEAGGGLQSPSLPLPKSPSSTSRLGTKAHTTAWTGCWVEEKRSVPKVVLVQWMVTSQACTGIMELARGLPAIRELPAREEAELLNQGMPAATGAPGKGPESHEYSAQARGRECSRKRDRLERGGGTCGARVEPERELASRQW